MSDYTTPALIYCRVSDPKQKTQGHGLESQELRCRQFAEKQGLTVETKPFLDDVTGGGNFNKRPAMMQLLDYLKRHRKTNYIVIVDDILRASRDVYFYWDLIYKLEELGAQPMSPNFVFERTPEGNLQQTVTVAAGAYQRESGARQTRQKMIARLEQGFHVFIAPVGFKYVKTKEHGKMLWRDEPAASVIAEAFEGFASGRFQTKQEVRYFLESRPEFPKTASGKMGNDRSDQILTNPLYAGYVGYKPWGVSVRKGRHEGMVSYETFLKVQARLQGRAHAPARKNLNKDFVLRGSVCCEACGNAFTAAWSKSRTGKLHPYYICQTRSCRFKGKSIRRDVLEGEFAELLKRLTPSRALIITLSAMFRTLWDHRAAAEQTRRKLFSRDMAGIDRKIENIIDRIADCDSPIVIKGLERKAERLEDDRRVLAEKIAGCGRPVRPFDEMYRTALQFLAKPYETWASRHYEERKAVVKLALTERITYVRNKGYRTPEFSLPFKMLDGFLGQEKAMVPGAGLEPAWPLSRGILSPLCLPIPPPGPDTVFNRIA